MDNLKIILFGASNLGKVALKNLLKNNIKVQYFCDNDERKKGKRIDGIEIIDFEELKRINNDNLMIIISSAYVHEIKTQLIQNGFNKIIIYNEIINSEIIKNFIQTTNLKKYGVKDAEYFIDRNKSINQNSIIYSLGIGEEITFDKQISDDFGCNIYAFDPTPKAKKFIENEILNNCQLNKKIKFYQYAISKSEEILKFYLPQNDAFVSGSVLDGNENLNEYILVESKSLKSIMNELGHKSIDILKMDIEGAEYDVLESIINNNIFVKQILVEFHHRFNNLDSKDTINIINKLIKYKYKIAHISDSGEEWTFIKV